LFKLLLLHGLPVSESIAGALIMASAHTNVPLRKEAISAFIEYGGSFSRELIEEARRNTMVDGRTIEEAREVLSFVIDAVESKEALMRQIETRDKSPVANDSRTIFRNTLNYILQNNGIPTVVGDINATIPIPHAYSIERWTESTVATVVTNKILESTQGSM
jgi:hypothetical protein